jgi:hypothetical protein
VEAPARTSNAPSILQLVLGILSLGLALLSTLGLALLAAASQQMDGSMVRTVRYTAWISLMLAALTVPSIIFAIRRLSHREEKTQTAPTFLIASLLMISLIPLGWLATRPAFEQIPAALWACFNLLFVAVPAWWFIELGNLGLLRFSRQRKWGLLNFSVFVSMPVSILVEVIGLLIGAALLIAWLLQDPRYAALANQAQNLMYVNPESFPLILDQLQPLMQNPGVIAAAMVAIAVAVPLIEELLKPLALWFFVKKHWSPREGFIAGLLCGAAFAVVESLTALASSGTSSMALVVARSGTGLLHITTAGLFGWALTSSWRDGKALRAGGVYLLNVLMHGMWNFLAVSTGIGALAGESSPAFFASLAPIAPWIMGGLVLLFLALIVLMNRHLKLTDTAALPPQLPPPLEQVIDSWNHL